MISHLILRVVIRVTLHLFRVAIRILLHLDFSQVAISGESNNWHLGTFRKGLFRTCGMYCLNAIGFVQTLLKVLSGNPSAEN